MPSKKRTKTLTSTKVISEETPLTASQTSRVVTSAESKKPWAKIATIAALVVLIVAGIGYIFKNELFVASVNGQLISRLDLLKKLEERSGKEVVDSLVMQILIQQEARKKGISIQKDVVDAEVKKIEDRLSAQGQKLEDALAAEGYTRTRLEDEIVVRKSLEKLVEDKTTVTEEEIDTFMKENAAYLSQDADQTKAREEAAEQLKNEKISSVASGFLDELRTQAKISYFRAL